MFDRILQIIDKCSSETFPKQLVDDALMVYFDKGTLPAEQFLITTKNLSPAQATELVSSIEKENNRLNKQALLINSIGFSAAFILLVFALIMNGYFSMIVYGTVAIAWGLALRKSVNRYRNAKKKARETERERGLQA
jgi:hypothetical protein